MNDWVAIPLNAVLAALAAAAHLSGVSDASLQALAFLLVADWATGIVKSYSIGNPITSRRGWIGIVSKGLVLMLPLSVAALGAAAEQDMASYAAYSITLLAVNEAYSIWGNVLCVVYKKDLPEWSIFEIAYGKIQLMLEGLVKK